MRVRLGLSLLAALAVSCAKEEAEDPSARAPKNGSKSAVEPKSLDAPLEPPLPGTPGGLPDDRTPLSEAPFSRTSAQGAADVVQTYYALLGAKKYREAHRLWSNDGRGTGMSAAEFAESFRMYAQYRANVGAPGRIEGAAGTLHVEVPVQVYGRELDGREFNLLGRMRLRRSNDVPGSPPAQRNWKIEKFIPAG